jgi:tRNA threonylcarbamoyladenosine biosynthesis protein TsaB
LSVALMRGPAVLAQHYEARSQQQAARLAPVVQDALREAGVKPADLDMIGVTVGPGSFTGIRIGLAFARGLALALDRPLAARTTFDAVADAATSQRPDPALRLVAAIDSKREEIFVQAQDGDPVMLAPAQAAATLPPGRYGLIGDAAPALLQGFAARGREGECVVLSDAPPCAAAFAPVLAAQGVEAWRQRNEREGMPRPYYLRAPDVTLGKHRPVP